MPTEVDGKKGSGPPTRPIALATMSREMTGRLLLYCARHHLDAEAQAIIEECLNQGVDWEDLLGLAKRHKLLPLLRYRLRGMDAGRIPPSVRDFLQGAYYASLLRNEQLQDELRCVVEALRERKIETVVLKGGALAGTVYTNLALRPMIDLDILIRREDIGPVRPALERMGYRPSAAIPARLQGFSWLYGGGLEFMPDSEEGHSTVLDLHWHLVTIEWYRYASAIDVEAMWSAARPLALGATSTWQLSPEDTLIHLCLHLGIQHGYDCPLIQYVDIDWLVHSYDLQWGLLVERASDFRVRTPVYWGLLLARRLLETAVPLPVLQVLQPPGYRWRVMQRLMPRQPLPPENSTSVARNRLLRVSLIDRPRDIIKMVLRTLFPRREWLVARYTLKDGTAVHLYRLIHPLQVMQALARAVLCNVQPLGIFYVGQPRGDQAQN
jgi:hypothetical protein